MPRTFHEFRVVLCPIAAPDHATGSPQQFVAIVSAEDLDGAKCEAERLVQALKGLVSVVSVTAAP